MLIFFKISIVLNLCKLVFFMVGSAISKHVGVAALDSQVMKRVTYSLNKSMNP